MSTNDQYLEFAKQVATKAGEIMKKYFLSELEIDLKAGDEIVTVADREVNDMVINEVARTYPDHGIDGEEASQHMGREYMWVCDPIDGTNPFAVGLPISVFSLALVVNGVPVVGVIYDPYYDRMYTGIKGAGAFMNQEPIKVSSQNFTGKVARINVDWWPTADYDTMKPMYELSKEKNAYMLTPGSTTHMAALVARGEFAASVFSGTKGKNVDIAAAKVIVEEAGGKVTDLFGEEQRYDQPIKGAVVSNGVVHDTIVAKLTDALGDK